jgi:hypothetical protein
MIITETITINNKEFIRHYSDANFYIQKVNTEEIYSEAVDPIEFTDRTYIETSEKIEEPTEEAGIQDYQDALGEFGVQL